jgi:hypothetical protein
MAPSLPRFVYARGMRIEMRELWKSEIALIEFGSFT